MNYSKSPIINTHMEDYMKYFTIIIIILISLTCIAKPIQKSFTGTVININNNIIELKYKNIEKKFIIDEKTKITKNNKTQDVNAIKICQKVRINYIIKNKQFFITKLIIQIESYCSE